MAGSLPGIPLSQQFDASGRLLRGGLLQIYAANTTTPQIAFQDSGLTIPHPWPVPADGSGRIPMFYLADGAVHVRLLGPDGTTQFDYPSMLVIGPSSGGGGGGGGVDPTAIFQTGWVTWLDQSGPIVGWVRDNARTIGNATSGASERANADAQALFIYLYNTFPDAVCPVLGGRGANALADFSAGKQITTPDKRGYSPIGLPDMGNADSGRLAGVPFTQGNATTAGSLGGEATHKLLAPELPVHAYTDQGHIHSGAVTVNGNPVVISNAQVPSTGGTLSVLNVSSGGAAVVATASGQASIINTGGDGSHNNIGLVVPGTFYRKL